MLKFKLTDRIQQVINQKQQIILFKDKEKEILEAQITKKDDHNIRLRALFQGTAVIFQKQLNYTNKLKEDLEKESQDKNISAEKSQHLKVDIQRLDQEKAELEQRVKELELNRTESEKLRDEELKQEKEKVSTLTAQLNNAIKTDELIYNLLGQYSSKENLLERTQEVVDKLKQEALTDREKELLKDIHEFNQLGILGFDSFKNLPPIWKEIRKKHKVIDFSGLKLNPMVVCLYWRMTEAERGTNEANAWRNSFPFADGNPSLVTAQMNRLRDELEKLKLSENDQQTLDYLIKCDLNSFPLGTIEEYRLAEWEPRIQAVGIELDKLEPHSEILDNYLALALTFQPFILNWINLQRLYNQSNKRIEELEIQLGGQLEEDD